MCLIRIGGDEYDGNVVTIGAQAVLQIKSTQPRHMQVRDDTLCIRNNIGLRELLGRLKCTSRKTEREYQVLKTASRPRIVVDDANHGRLAQLKISLPQDTYVKEDK